MINHYHLLILFHHLSGQFMLVGSKQA